MLKTRQLPMPLPFLKEYDSLEIPQCFGHVDMVDLSRTVSFQSHSFYSLQSWYGGRWEGVEYFSFASDENFFYAYHTGESFTPRKTRFLTAGEKNRQLFVIQERMKCLFILFAKKQSFVIELLMNN